MQTENTSTLSAADCREVLWTDNLVSLKPAENVIIGAIKTVIFGQRLPKNIIDVWRKSPMLETKEKNDEVIFK
ncbi:MAG TPA: hypothetical protein DIU00_00040 [Phycisphaerales bacterium]|nr:hypothetical protein [Phycisphaerales bacterium]